MANLPETPQWEDGVYQIEVSDPVLGGPDGISNRQAKQLASRTTYLKQKVEKGGTDLASHIAAADPHPQYAPKASPVFTGTPTAPTPAVNDNSKKLVTTEFVARAIAALAGTAPETLDTLKELADALGNDPNFAATMTNSLAGKMDKAKNGGDIPNVAAFLENLGLSDAAHLPQLTGVIGTSRNARMSVTAASATATFTADELIVQAALGGRQYKLTSFSKVINLATTGAGGMDMSAAPASGYVALYAIYNPTTQASALLAVNATSVLVPEVYSGANMPSGYTASALIAVWGTASSLLKVGFLSGRHISIPPVNAYTATVGTIAVTPFSLSATVPLNAICVDVSMGVGQTTSGSGVGMSIFSSSTGIAQIGATAATSGATSSSGVTGTLPLIDPQRLYYSMSNATVGSYNVACRGYEF